MKVRTGDSAGLAYGAQNLACIHNLTRFDIDSTHVAVHGNEPLAVIEQHRIAIEEVVSGCSDSPSSWRLNDFPLGTRNIEATVRVARLIVEEPA